MINPSHTPSRSPSSLSQPSDFNYAHYIGQNNTHYESSTGTSENYDSSLLSFTREIILLIVCHSGAVDEV